MKKYLLTATLGLTLTGAWGQRAPIVEEQPYIDVTGTVEKELVPDEIYIRITLQEKYEHKEKVSIEAQEEQLKAALKAAGIRLENMYLADADAGYVRVSKKAAEVLTSKSFTLMVSKVPEVTKVFLELDKLDISNAAITSVDYAALDSIRKSMRIEAVKAAKAKADYLLAAIGQHTGKALIVQDRDAEPVPPSGLNVQYKYMQYENNTLEHYNLGKGDNLRFEKMKLRASVYTRFQIQ